jgi:hypothetical protein
MFISFVLKFQNEPGAARPAVQKRSVPVAGALSQRI